MKSDSQTLNESAMQNRAWVQRLTLTVMFSGLTLVALANVSHSLWAQSGSAAQKPEAIRVESATVLAEVEIEVPAPMSGRISDFHVDENRMVAEGTLLAQIDDRRAQSMKRQAEARLAAAELEANDNSAILEAEATMELAQSEHQRNVELLKTNSISPAEADRTELAAKQAELRLLNRQRQLELAQKKLDIAQLELSDADQEIEFHKVTSPGTGNVYTIYHQKGEWVTEGEPLVKVVSMEWLRVEGTISNTEFNREDVLGRRVTIEIERARGEIMSFEGQVTWTGLREVSGRNIQVRAAVRNRVVADHWVLHPGAHVRMTIHDEQGSLAELPESLRR